MGAEEVHRPPSGELTVRPVRMEDAEALNALRRQPSVAALIMALPSERVQSTRQFVESLTPNEHVMVAERDGRVVGIGGLHVQQGKLRHVGIIGVAVGERFQGQGIGRRLMDTLLDLADNWIGLVRLELEVLAENTRAIRLYESLGFEIEGCQRQRIFRAGRYSDSLIMGRIRRAHDS